jgi:hypothetical protein
MDHGKAKRGCRFDKAQDGEDPGSGSFSIKKDSSLHTRNDQCEFVVSNFLTASLCGRALRIELLSSGQTRFVNAKIEACQGSSSK